MKKFLVFLLCIGLIFSGISVSAGSAKQVASEYLTDDINTPLAVETAAPAKIGDTVPINAKSAILLEPYTGEILYEKNADERLSPASITKIMGLLLVMEEIEKGNLKLTDVITVSEHAAGMGGSQIWLEPGERMSVDDLLKAAVIASANDAMAALGEAVAGSEETFVQKMNQKAKELGLNNTNFVNCTGLDAENHYSSAHDIAVMAGELIKHEQIKKYSTVWMDTLRGGKTELVNTNKLVRFYDGCTGLKTGTTSTAGCCLAATAKRQNMELVAVVMKADNTNERFLAARKLLDLGFANYSFCSIGADISDSLSLKVTAGESEQVKIDAGEELKLLLKKGDNSRIIKKIILPESVKAPVKKSDILGSVSVLLDNNEIGTIELKAASDVKKINFATTFLWLICALIEL